MLSHSLKCRKNTESKNPKFARTKSGRIIQNVQCVINQNLSFLKQQEASGLLSSFGMKAPLIEIPSAGPLLF